ncbi:kynureninase [Roseibium suaedae]|uniref:Kynureninase n=1 Tax=Roseibium suaedae TaxID=735517 RepID=A0A1M7A9U2_9HYPH|nr:kynureninase [Roseibium suaedae]SHL39493.1 Kynureninase [Roseibium suaedae]
MVHALDAADVLATKREAFDLPEGVIYLDGNSLGVLPAHVPSRMAEVIKDQWGTSLVRGWNDHDWIDLPQRVGARIGRLIGAAPGSVVAGDSTSINVFKVLSAALTMRSDRKVILSDNGNFPTDLYVASGLAKLLDAGHELRIVDPDKVEANLGDDIAVMMITEVDYKTGRRHDMKALTAKAHQHGVIAIWDLAHSAGAVPVDLDGAKADFAVGCGYKYLNGGPGAPAFLYVAERHHGALNPALTGWMGHEAPFAFDLDYRPATGIDRMRVGTPPILSLSALDAALDVFDDVDMDTVHRKSVSLCDLFIKEVESRCPELELVTPRDPSVRGSHVSFRFEEGYALMQALIAEGVIGDFRAPDIARFGFTPLYLSHADVVRAAEILEGILRNKTWMQDEFKKKQKVT